MAKPSPSANAFDVHYALLNKAQKRAVDHTDGPMLVLAGAGTGKTQIIALRIAKLLRDTDTAPPNILCLTFTESGVAAMRERLIALIGEAGYHVRVTTFHALCNEIIQEHPEIFFLDTERQALNDIERVQLFQWIIDELPATNPLKPFGSPYSYLTELVRTIQTLKRENIPLERYRQLVEQAAVASEQAAAEQKSSPKQKKSAKQKIAAKSTSTEADTTISTTELRRQLRLQRLLARQRAVGECYEHYQTRLHELGRYDYEDMLLLVTEQFASNPDLLADYQERYHYILVDEYQDTNGAQNELVRLLSSGLEQPNLFVVGDDRQSIYRFQGASLENILYFHKLFGRGVALVSLQDNYRSQQYILDAAEEMIVHNNLSLEKVIPELSYELKAARDLPLVKLSLARFTTRAVENYWIATTIQRLLAEGAAARDIAVLYRNHSDAEDLIALAAKLDIPVHIAAGVDVLSDPLVAQFVRLLHYLGLSGSDEELFHILHFQFFNLPVLEIARLTQIAQQQKQWLLDACLNAANQSIRQLAERLLNWRTAAHNLLLADWFARVAEETGWLAFVQRQPNSLEHLNHLSTLFETVTRLNRDQRSMSLRDLFSNLQLLQEHDISITEQELYTTREAVQFMTAHRAKGLEFSHVFIMHCVDKRWGNVPQRSKLSLPAGILQFESEADLAAQKNEDERRLFYVALTRAKQRIYLSYAKTSPSGSSVNPSQFISELPEELIETEKVTAVEQDALSRLEKTLAPRPAAMIAAAGAIKVSEEERAWWQDRLKHYRMSATHYNDYLECPRLFFYDHIVRVPRPPHRAISFGVAVHAALRDAATEYNRTGALPPIEFLLDRFRAVLQQQLLSKKDLAESLTFGEQVIVDYLADPIAATVLTANKFPEHDFGQYQIMIGQVPVTGKIDALRLLDERNKQVHMIDYKTGNPDNKGKQLAKQGPYHRQLLFYKLLVDGAKELGLTAASGEIHFVQKSKRTGEFISKHYEFKGEDVAALRVDLERVYNEIKQLTFLEAADRFCGECRYCAIEKIS